MRLWRDNTCSVLLSEGRRYVQPTVSLSLTLGLGHKDEALRWLENDFDDRDDEKSGLSRSTPCVIPCVVIHVSKNL
jgi:hypothetical protein